MNPKYERVREIFKKSYRDTATVMIGWNDAEKAFVDQIVAHNKKCEKDIGENTREFWEQMLEGAEGINDALYAIIDSPYAPHDIVETAVRKSTNPHNLTRALGKDIDYTPQTLDVIQKRAKKEICDILKSCYNPYERRPLPFNQYAIDYYAQKTFNKSNVKNDKMLIMLAYTKNEELLKDVHRHPLLNENRLNYLINNENISEPDRDKMFMGIGYNIGDITPDYNAIISPTKMMIDEIYRSNSDAYFYAGKSEKNIKNAAINKIHEMYRHGLLGESIEKDIIARYEKGDQTYRWLLRCVLRDTKNMGTVEFAKSLDSRIYSEVFQNTNIPKKEYKEMAEEYIDKILKTVKRAKRLSGGNYNVGKPLATAELRRDQYDTFFKVNDTFINASLCHSPYTPDDILEQLTHFHNEQEEGYSYLNVALSAKVNLEMRKRGYSEEDIATWSTKFVQSMRSYYNIDGVLTYNSIDEDYAKLIKERKLDAFIDMVKDIQKEMKEESEQDAINNFFKFAEGYREAYERNLSEDIGEVTIKKLYDERNSIMNEFRFDLCLGAIYVKIDDYADRLIELGNEIEDREEEIKLASSRGYSR